MWRTAIIGLILTLLAVARVDAAPAAVDRNVVYGMYSGLALIMDVYRPAKPNGAAIVAIQGSGWYVPMRYDAAPINSRTEVIAFANHLADAGYVVFAISHRAAPRFRFPAQLEDAQRAVRFVRAHAGEYGVDVRRIGAFGTSSGGHLAELLGKMDSPGDAASADPVERPSAKVSAVVALFAPSDLRTLTTERGIAAPIALMGFEYQDPAKRRPGAVRENEFENIQYALASPITHVSRGDAQMLLMHGDADDIIPIGQSMTLEAALKAAGVEVRLIRVAGGGHGEDFRFPKNDPRIPDQFGETRRWFDAHLQPVH
jgi:acetyl esterase/lipase